MRFKVQRSPSEDTGATAVEIGLIAAGLSVALITLAGQFGGDDARLAFDHVRMLISGLNFRFMF